MWHGATTFIHCNLLRQPAVTTEAHVSGVCALQQEKPPQGEAYALQLASGSCSQQWRHNTAINKSIKLFLENHQEESEGHESTELLVSTDFLASPLPSSLLLTLLSSPELPSIPSSPPS